MSAIRVRVGGLAAALLMIMLPLAAQAAEGDYPNRVVRLIVPFPAGSGPDANARILVAGMARPLGQQIVIDNRPGASGILSTQLVAKSAPDGYTLLLGTASVFGAVPTLYDKLPYDPDRDFIPVSMIELLPCALVVNAALAAKNVKELIALVKAKPGELTFGSAGNGGFHHLSAELFKTLTGVNMRHIPYGTGGPYTDLVSGQVPLMFDTFSPFLPNIKAGKLRALAVSGKERRPQVPQVPTFIEAGVPGFDSAAWYGPIAPAGTPRAIVTRLHTAVTETLKSAEVAERLTNVSAGYIVGSTPEEYAAFIQTERAKWARVIRQTGVKLAL